MKELLKAFKACNYLAVGMISLKDNPLLREPLRREHLKKRLLGHWGASPNISFVYLFTSYMLRKYPLNALLLVGPGHGAPGYIAPLYLEGTLSKFYPEFSQDKEGMKRLFKAFSFPGGLGSHCTPELPGSIQEGGELGYSLSHAFGAVFDNPDLVAVAIVGDGEAETGPLATAWHSNKFLNPKRDGLVLPVLSLNGYKINNPTLLARIPKEELISLLKGYGYEPLWVEGEEPEEVSGQMKTAMESAFERLMDLRGKEKRPVLPAIVLKTPKGWTAPKEFRGKYIEGYWRSHQVPLSDVHENPDSLKLLEEWLQSYKPEELFDQEGRPLINLSELFPEEGRRLGDTPFANGGLLRKPLDLPKMEDHSVERFTLHNNTLPLGYYLREVLRRNPHNFRVFGPDETASNRLHPTFESGKVWMLERLPVDEDEGYLSPTGKVMEMLSEHTVEGWLEGYLLTGRYGILSTYEGFAPIITSMVNQFGKWLDISQDVPWRAPISSLNLLLTSVVWRQDHNGFTHQDPGFINSIVDKWPNVVRLYFPCDANTLLITAELCLKSTNRVNIIVVDKQAHPQYLDYQSAYSHAIKGIGIFDFASTHTDKEPDLVLASCGDIPTKEAIGASLLLREFFPDLAIRFVNVVNLFRLTPDSEHPDGLPDRDFDAYFTTDKPIIFNFHGYPWLIHRLTYRRKNHKNLHVRGYRENRKIGIDATQLQPFLKGRGGITTPLQLAILNQTDRFSIAIDAIQRTPALQSVGGRYIDLLKDMQIKALRHAYEEGVDAPEFSDENFLVPKLRKLLS
ncbi:phosphoketolase family protein [Hydrogenobacter sp. T-2]|uniref:phosphoketolase family protein n=1 Tax=Pampinifervens diazotrophicum TaxID=1632018 RepID=UPI002B260211|nr:phosphoketolase family protein [Hydrogenobacter sp. T-2]WPM32676.1 phosphoketolase family protein [Hydrogenobacter sp. T-2]